MRMRYCPSCASPLGEHQWEGRLRQVCPACGFVNYENPVPAAGCLVERGGCVLLVQRRFEPSAGGWTLPAGFIEWGETPERAAERETEEETGLRVRIGRLLGVFPWYREFGENHPNDSGVLIIYAGEVLAGDLHAGDDAQDVGWFAADDLPAPIAFASHRAALAQWADRRKREGSDCFPSMPAEPDDEAPAPQAEEGNG
jgi:8-oxo-dGTP diphosphatase